MALTCAGAIVAPAIFVDKILRGTPGLMGFAPLQAKTIECNDIETALEAWNWLRRSRVVRFEIDDTPHAIQACYERVVRWHAARVAGDMERRQ